MNALDQICFLEQQIHDLARAQQEYEGRALKARGDIKKLQLTLEVATRDVMFHGNNVRHVKLASTGDVVLNEFAKAKRNLTKARANYENTKAGIRLAEGTIAKCRSEVEGAGRRIAALKRCLAEYGQLLEFPTKKEPKNG